jgi:hypothetical protein
MSKMGEYAVERERELAQHRPRIRVKKPGNVPVALCEQRADTLIAECIKKGLDAAAADAEIIVWNANQPSPLKVSVLRQRIYLAYRALEAGSD